MTTRLIDYHYDECGLENVILKNFPVIVDDAGDEVVTIPNINLLHKVLVGAVAMKETGLNPAEVRFLRTEIGMSQAQLAKIVGRDTQTIGRWERGETEIDQASEMVVRMKAIEHVGETGVSVEDLARRTIYSAVHPPLLIDAHDPSAYKRIAA